MAFLFVKFHVPHGTKLFQVEHAKNFFVIVQINISSISQTFTFAGLYYVEYYTMQINSPQSQNQFMFW